MDGNCLKRNSIDSYDRISELPDEIILAILCCLPLKEAASTSVLSSRWLDLWKHSPKLEFTTKIDAELVSSILDSHKALSLDAFNISFHIDKSSHSQVTKWLDFGFSRRVRTLRLDFQCNRSMNMVVLEEVVRESRISPLFFKSLQRLRLEGLKMSGEGIDTFLHNCPSLKCLTIIYANFTSNVEICGTGRLVLRYLNLYYSTGRKSIKISAPNLICALVDQESGKVMFENVPKLKRLTFRIRNQKYLMQHFARATSCSISTLQSLALTLYHPKEFLASGTFPEMPNLKELLVKDYGVYDHGSLLPLTDLLWACPHLREFKLKFAGDLKNATSVPMNVERRVHRHLKMFEFQGSSGGVSDRIVELAAYISEKCVALEHVVIGRPLSGIVEDEGDREYLKLQLQGKLPQHIQVQLFANVY